MLSGGRDSVCLLHRLRWPAMHMNYGLRPEADGDEAFCRALCESLDVPLTVVRPASEPVGNLQAWARAERYAAAERLTEGEIAVAHTASDQAETVLYRLLTSGALRGMPERRGRVVRPLLSWSREQVTAYCVENGLSWREDSSNADERFARNRIRALLASFPAGEANVLRQFELLVEEGEVLASLVEPSSSVDELRSLPPALLRLTLARMAGVPVRDPEACLRGADLGGGVRSVVEHGHLRFDRGAHKAGIAPVEFTAPSQIRFGEGVLTATGSRFVGVARTWRPGDRMRPAGMGGHSKSLQDIFTDRKVPRTLRHRLPVVESGGEIAWVPGVASESFAGRGVWLSWELGSA
jgi:tRNA(Ile)-lysidine synthase